MLINITLSASWTLQSSVSRQEEVGSITLSASWTLQSSVSRQEEVGSFPP